MYLADYHTHCKYSMDGSENPEDMCQKAIELGLTELAITDHMDFYSIHNYEYALNCHELYPLLQSLREKYKDSLKLKVGAEVGQPMANPKAYQAFLEDYPDLDFIIGSVHMMENDLDLYYYNWKRRDPTAVYDHYLDWLLDFAANYDYDVLGHLTYPLRYMAESGVALDMTPFLPKFRELFAIVVGRGKGIELNVSGFRQELQTSMPSPSLLRLYQECGGRILTIGSDAHKVKDLGTYIRVGQEVAKECGFTHLASFEKRVATLIPIE